MLCSLLKRKKRAPNADFGVLFVVGPDYCIRTGGAGPTVDALFGHDVSGTPISDLVVKEDGIMLMMALKQCMDSSLPAKLEVRLRLGGGVTAPTQVNLFSLTRNNSSNRLSLVLLGDNLLGVEADLPAPQSSPRPRTAEQRKASRDQRSSAVREPSSAQLSVLPGMVPLAAQGPPQPRADAEEERKEAPESVREGPPMSPIHSVLLRLDSEQDRGRLHSEPFMGLEGSDGSGNSANGRRSSGRPSSELANSGSMRSSGNAQISLSLSSSGFSSASSLKSRDFSLCMDREIQTDQVLVTLSTTDAATNTDIVWGQQGFRCTKCSRPPVQAGTLRADDVARSMGVKLGRRKKRGAGGVLDGLWTVLGRDEQNIDQCLHRIMFRGRVCADREGNRWSIFCEGDKVMLAGGQLYTEGEFILHRLGRNGCQVTFTRGSGGREMPLVGRKGATPLSSSDSLGHKTRTASSPIRPLSFLSSNSNSEDSSDEQEAKLPLFGSADDVFEGVMRRTESLISVEAVPP